MNTRFCITDLKPAVRADKFIAALLPEYSRSFWKKQFELGYICLNGTAIESTAMLSCGEVTITIPVYTPATLTLPIVYEDNNVLVIDKPAGLLTHAKGVVAEEATVADFVRLHTTDAPESNRPGIVHRLDRDTYGVLVAAKNPDAKHWLQAQFSQRKVKKTYIALVKGHLPHSEAVLKLPIERSPKEPQKFRVNANGKSAETAYKVLQEFSRYSLVELYPHTGRTHQLRVHMAYLGHPIVGDRLYGQAEKALQGRLFLHAQQLEITLPSRKRKTFTTPMPEELQQFINNIS
jgi:23S rRNA pseudouridine1911/1915/1917 synthase